MIWRCFDLWSGASDSLAWTFHMAFGRGWAWVQVFEDQFLGDVRAPFEETFLSCFEECRYLGVAQQLVCKFDLVCLS